MGISCSILQIRKLNSEAVQDLNLRTLAQVKWPSQDANPGLWVQALSLPSTSRPPDTPHSGSALTAQASGPTGP